MYTKYKIGVWDILKFRLKREILLVTFLIKHTIWKFANSNLNTQAS